MRLKNMSHKLMVFLTEALRNEFFFGLLDTLAKYSACSSSFLVASENHSNLRI